MYDFETNDDYTKFLAETFFNPETPAILEDTLGTGANGRTTRSGTTAAETSGAVAEEEELDPDYMFQDIEDFTDMNDEYKYDRTTKIPRKEVDTLINEIITAYDLDQTEGVLNDEVN